MSDHPTEAAVEGSAGQGLPLKLVRGDASPEELAAVVAVLSAASAAGVPPPAPRHTSRWSARERAVRRPIAPGPGAWRASAWPR